MSARWLFSCSVLRPGLAPPCSHLSSAEPSPSLHSTLTSFTMNSTDSTLRSDTPCQSPSYSPNSLFTPLGAGSRSPMYSPTSPSPSFVFSCPTPGWEPAELEDFEHPNFLRFECPNADLVIHTRDSQTLYAHRVILLFASSSLQSLVLSAVAGEIHLQDESSGAVRSLLEWVYPHTSMNIANFGALDAALSVAKKYQLDAMQGALRSMLHQPGSPVNLRKDPIRAYSIATAHGLTSDAQEAARLAVGVVDFRRAGVLEELTESGVSVECAFRLAQKQFAWECALADSLLRTSTSSGEELILKGREWKRLVCVECVSWDEVEGPMGLVQWQRNWAERVYERLVCTPLDDCAYMFRTEYVTRVWNEGCERCMIRLMRDQDMLNDWMDRVWKMVNRKWEQIFGTA
ncbi:hypothetical protein FS749_002320 [Ceratobasidium sp. UAMH 11750]|nr:hypothetical protein FS749_002320 [Ceratobasidium sp. UAMH 11750]